jgi:hypothetical protein
MGYAWDAMLTSAIGFKRLAKSLVKSYSVDFGALEMRLNAAKGEVDAEIRLASEQRAHSSHALQQIEFSANERHRSDFRVEVRENRESRLLQQTEAKANRWFRSQQLVDMSERQDRQIQKIVKEEGTAGNINPVVPIRCLTECHCRAGSNPVTSKGLHL